MKFRRLAAIHNWNAYLVAVLAVTGIILYLPPLRAPLAAVRVPLKSLHIALGVLSIVVLLTYLPGFTEHWRRLKKLAGRRANLVLALLLVGGWGASGMVLWWERSLPGWGQPALLIHDWLTWLGLPWAAGHGIVRWWRWRLPLPWDRQAPARWRLPEDPEAVGPVTRRRFLEKAGLAGVGVILAALLGSWLLIGRGTTSLTPRGEDPTADRGPGWPVPEPLPESNPPIGGGGEGTFRYYTVTSIPLFDPETWRFRVDGLVDHPLEFTWEEFMQVPRVVLVRDFHCVTGWSVRHVTWEGIPLGELLARAGIKDDATHVKLYSADGVYTDALTLDQARLDDNLVVLLKDGKPLYRFEGGPVRLFIPAMYGYKSVKWLNRAELTNEPHIGFWEERGYALDAWLPGRRPAGEA